MPRTIIGVTGATGIAFTLDFLRRLDGEKFAIFTQWGRHLLSQETGLSLADVEGLVQRIFPDTDLSAPTSSGSTLFDALVILSCSSGTLNKIAAGIADTLLTRTALVALKERRKLVLCLRETPVSTQTLRNAAQLSADGAVIMPIMPPYYMHPLTTDAVLEGFSKRLLQVLGRSREDLWKPGQLEPDTEA
jgi:polyprenyl P-hydroxybenzoate/phenylacrylic acid decarboxylase-like protein